MENKIRMIHGDGGEATASIISRIFYKHFDNDLLINSLDSAVFHVETGRLAFTTDSFVVKPVFFPGGDLGKLSVCGTVNDLCVSGAQPLYISLGVIIEEGFDISELDKLARSIADTCNRANVNVITGDTKVVEKGCADKIFINTSGVGVIKNDYVPKKITEGDKIIVTGGIGEHGTAIAVERYNLNVTGSFKSDCMPLTELINKIGVFSDSIKLMKDPTRGGLATCLNEMAHYSKLGIHLKEEKIPIKDEIKSVNNIIGFDPLYLACEGRMVIVVDKENCERILDVIKNIKSCENAEIIGNFSDTGQVPIVYLETFIGGTRILGPLEGELLPRIC